MSKYSTTLLLKTNGLLFYLEQTFMIYDIDLHNLNLFYWKVDSIYINISFTWIITEFCIFNHILSLKK